MESGVQNHLSRRHLADPAALAAISAVPSMVRSLCEFAYPPGFWSGRMKIRIEECEPERLRVLFSMNLGSRVWSFCFGSTFTIVGVIFLGSSLPHTEFLRRERLLHRIACTKGQRFGDLRTTGEQTLIIKPGTMVSIEEVTNEGNHHSQNGHPGHGR
jgi:hypothetical protein